MIQASIPLQRGAVRVDLHCHSCASTEAGEALLTAINCPESYSRPAQVYAQAKRRGMDYATITDHDSIDGVAELLNRGDVISGEEVTCYFPEDNCKMHVLVWGIDPRQHRELQTRARDIYELARFIAAERIAHAVAHPLYRQNDKLELWHVERLLLLFKGFECLNGAHSSLHREAFEPVLDESTPERILLLSRRHGIAPLWDEPHIKSRTGGSDDHGLFNIGRTWTEFPPDVETAEKLLECLRTGRCAPGGEAGSSLKLAHNFFGVGIRFFANEVASPEARERDSQTLMLRRLVGDVAAPTKLQLLGMAAGEVASNVSSRIRGLAAGPQSSGTGLLKQLFRSSIAQRLGDHEELKQALLSGEAPLAEHEAMFALVSELNRDITAGIARSVKEALGRGEIAPIFDTLSAVAAHQFLMLPYYFALFHQNRERHHLQRVTGTEASFDPTRIRLGAFAETLENVAWEMPIGEIASLAGEHGRSMLVHTCAESPDRPRSWEQQFPPLATLTLPAVLGGNRVIPPLLQIMEFCDRQQFDVIHCAAPGPIGLCGWLVAKMLRAPMTAACWCDWLATVEQTTGGDYRMVETARGYLAWFYSQAEVVFTLEGKLEEHLRELGVPAERIVPMRPAHWTSEGMFTAFWQRSARVAQTVQVQAASVAAEKLPANRVGVEKVGAI